MLRATSRLLLEAAADALKPLAHDGGKGKQGREVNQREVRQRRRRMRRRRRRRKRRRRRREGGVGFLLLLRFSAASSFPFFANQEEGRR
jgi:hypothetical protein